MFDVESILIRNKGRFACRFVYFTDEDENAEKEEELRQKELILIDYALKKIVNDQNGNNTGAFHKSFSELKYTQRRESGHPKA